MNIVKHRINANKNSLITYIRNEVPKLENVKLMVQSGFDINKTYNQFKAIDYLVMKKDLQKDVFEYLLQVFLN